MNPEQFGWYGGIAGSFIGLVGAVVGTWASLRAAKSAEERRYIVKWVAVFSLVIGGFLGVLFAVPLAYRGFVWMAYSPLLAWAILTCNRGHQRIRAPQS